MAFNIADVVGETKDAAEKLLKENGYKMRVVAEDGNHFFVTMDYRGDRVNVTVNNGLVSNVNSVG